MSAAGDAVVLVEQSLAVAPEPATAFRLGRFFTLSVTTTAAVDEAPAAARSSA
jgi:hypothetical protein